MTDLYNVLEKLRAGTKLTKKDRQINEQGLVTVMKELHDEIDAAVADAYGWPADLEDGEILQRLVDLNHVRAAEEAQGLVRYLRPEYQNPEGTRQAELDVETTTKAVSAAKETQKLPDDLPARMQAVQRALAAEAAAATVEDVASRFKHARRATVQSLLETLATLGLASVNEEGKYVA
ncbi:MAG: RNA-binding protein [Bacteroidetes bacterium]|nr:RNA-binding protein [Bacteroidota bacterium]